MKDAIKRPKEIENTIAKKYLWRLELRMLEYIIEANKAEKEERDER